jgi:hypothetical protein
MGKVESRGERLFLLLREGVLGFLFLSLGAVAWAAYSLRVGLGFTRLEIQQYAMASLFTLSYGALIMAVSMGSALLAALLVQSIEWKSPPGLVKAIRALMVVSWVAVGMVGLVAVLEALELYATDLRLDRWFVCTGLVALISSALLADLKANFVARFAWRYSQGLWIPLAVPLVLAGMIKLQGLELSSEEWLMIVFFALMPALYLALRPPFVLFPHRTKPKVRSSNKTRRIWKPTKKPTILEIDRSHLVLPITFTLLFSACAVGSAVLPHVDSHIGGAKARSAYLQLRPLDLDEDMRLVFFDDENATSDGVEETVKVTVVFRNSDFFFVRVPPNDGSNDRSYEIPDQQVFSVRWV